MAIIWHVSGKFPVFLISLLGSFCVLAVRDFVGTVDAKKLLVQYFNVIGTYR